MRKTREELLYAYPIWNEEKHDIVKASYGDIPIIHYDKNEYDHYQNWAKTDSTWVSIGGINAYIYRMNGVYDEYRPLIGNIKIRCEDEKVLCGNINVKYYGKTYQIILNQMYDLNSLDILRFDNGNNKTKGFSNRNGQGSPQNKNKTEELDKDVIEKVLNLKLEDYGYSVQKFMDACRKLYNQDKDNYIMNKTFNM